MRRKMFALSLKIPIPLRSAHGGTGSGQSESTRHQTSPQDCGLSLWLLGTLVETSLSTSWNGVHSQTLALFAVFSMTYWP